MPIAWIGSIGRISLRSRLKSCGEFCLIKRAEGEPPKRGGVALKLNLNHAADAGTDRSRELIALDDALNALAQLIRAKPASLSCDSSAA
jgi:hypothetical protein